jgi:hypothetical protein
MLMAVTVSLAIVDIGIVNFKIIQPNRSSQRGSQLMSKRDVDRFFQEDEIIKFLKQDESDFRIYPIDRLFGESRFASFGLESLGGYHPAKLKLYDDLINILNKVVSKALSPNNIDEVLPVPVWRMLNTKYIISYIIIPPHPELNVVVPMAMIRNRKKPSELINDWTDPSDKLRYLKSFVPVEVYEISNNMPRAWFVSEIQEVSEQDIWRKIFEPDFDPRQKAYVNVPLDITIGTQATIDNFEQSVHKTTITTESEGDQFLVVSEVFYPLRWKAIIDGIEVKTYKVNGILRGVEVPAGGHTIEFIYDKSSFNKGVLISFASFGLALGFIGFGFFKRKES